MKRYYHPNQEISYNGFKLSITSNGTVYHQSGKGLIKLDSLWLKRTRVLSVSLPDENELLLKHTKEGIKILNDKEIS